MGHSEQLGVNYTKLNEKIVKDHLRHICKTAKTDDEIQNRIRDELGYPYGPVGIISAGTGSDRRVAVMMAGPQGGHIQI